MNHHHRHHNAIIFPEMFAFILKRVCGNAQHSVNYHISGNGIASGRTTRVLNRKVKPACLKTDG